VRPPFFDGRTLLAAEHLQACMFRLEASVQADQEVRDAAVASSR
jgi:hypothetical protein